MKDNGFRPGNLEYKAQTGVTPDNLAKLLAETWQGGYVAFANGERRLDQLSSCVIDADLLTKRVQDHPGKVRDRDESLEGYVTEVNVWRQSGNVLEEIAAEREENSFLVVRYQLDTAPCGDGNCQYCEAKTMAGSYRSRLYSGEFATVEVVWPEKRLNVFISKGA